MASRIGLMARTVEGQRASESRYRTLFDSIDDGFTMLEVLYDAEGRPADLRYLATNPAYERQTGLRNCIGRTVREVLPDVEDAWVDAHARAAGTGESVRFEQHNESTGRWFSVFLVRVGGAGSAVVATLSSDVTEPKRVEEALRASAERDAFRLRLADALRPLGDPVQVQTAAVRVLGEHLRVARAFYSEIESDGDTMSVAADHAVGAPSMIGRHRLSDFGSLALEGFRQGRTIAKDDASADGAFSATERERYARQEMSAFVCVPLVTAGQLMSLMCVDQPLPRAWTVEEVALVEETAERTLAAIERAKADIALRESEERLRRALSIPTVGVVFFGTDGSITDANEGFLRMAGFTREDLESGRVRWDDLTPPESIEATLRALGEFTEQGKTSPDEKQYVRLDGSRWWALYAATRISDDLGVGFVVDITLQKEAEARRTLLEERLRTVVDAIEDYAIFALGPDGRITDWTVVRSGSRDIPRRRYWAGTWPCSTCRTRSQRTSLDGNSRRRRAPVVPSVRGGASGRVATAFGRMRSSPPSGTSTARSRASRRSAAN